MPIGTLPDIFRPSLNNFRIRKQNVLVRIICLLICLVFCAVLQNISLNGHGGKYYGWRTPGIARVNHPLVAVLFPHFVRLSPDRRKSFSEFGSIRLIAE